MKKRLITLMMISTLSFCLVACGGTGTQSTVQEEESEQEKAVQAETAEEAEQPTETAEPEPTQTEDTRQEEETIEPEQPAELTEQTEQIEPQDTQTESTKEVEEQLIEQIETPVVSYTFTDLSQTMYAKQTVNVRNQPDTSGEKLGSLSQNQEIQITGQCNENGWYRFEYNGQTAYVSNSYIITEKIEMAQQEQTAGQTTQASNSSWADGYEKHVWYDMGQYYFCICDDYDDGIAQLNLANALYDTVNPANSSFGFQYRQTLQERYPDMMTTNFGGPTKNGPYVVTILACSQDPSTGFPMWDVNFLWKWAG